MLAIVIEGLLSALVLPSIEVSLALEAAGQFQLGSGAALAHPGNGGCWEIGRARAAITPQRGCVCRGKRADRVRPRH